jgi:hypothetical protein
MRELNPVNSPVTTFTTLAIVGSTLAMLCTLFLG